MRKFKMTKSIFVLCIALSIFVCNPATAFAAVCSKSPDEVHHFSKCVGENEGYSSPELTHSYLYAFDNKGNEIYKTCEVTYHYKYCHYVCEYCNTRMSTSERHAHVVAMTHSANH